MFNEASIARRSFRQKLAVVAAECLFLDSKPVWEVSTDPEILAIAVAVFLLLLSTLRGRAILRLEFSNTQLNSSLFSSSMNHW